MTLWPLLQINNFWKLGQRNKCCGPFSQHLDPSWNHCPPYLQRMIMCEEGSTCQSAYTLPVTAPLLSNQEAPIKAVGAHNFLRMMDSTNHFRTGWRRFFASMPHTALKCWARAGRKCSRQSCKLQLQHIAVQVIYIFQMKEQKKNKELGNQVCPSSNSSFMGSHELAAAQHSQWPLGSPWSNQIFKLHGLLPRV